ncbi:hypothetical protein D9619_000055 [Psilocybe cf. subviscida]|uniref:Intradiol ring-cleavage dioxygenases domain-containing protein n=1 Tax=Psilocybe cf. subviscida TaxID=2480587 RepID=A0A8H5BEF8_9AGAR|nr:hypothetical protein D9619_000055 [Psilocybe cf. subviscida]
MLCTSAFAFIMLALSVAAHPGVHDEYDTIKKREFLAGARRTISNCRENMFVHGIEDESIERRAKLARKLREDLRLPHREHISKRSFATVLATSHLSNKTGLSSSSPSTDVFSGSINCVLQSETTEGPYWVKGELVRSDMSEGKPGIPLYTDYQIIDTNTCQPISNVYLDAWHANATGVYAGVVAKGNGNSADESNLNTTFNRGITKTDHKGVGFFKTVFPGHYTGRAVHIHLLTTHNPTLHANHTITGGTISHVGQVFFDQTLIDEVKTLSPYSTNKQTLTQNKADRIMSEEAGSMDPIMDYVWLGSSPYDGILAWITIGIDSKKSYSPHPAVILTSNGGAFNN